MSALSLSASASSLLQTTMLPDNNLRILNLDRNPVTKKIHRNDCKEKDALMALLDTFNAIYGLGKHVGMEEYAPDLEHMLRINHAGRKFVMSGGISGSGARSSKQIVINRALWPRILERAYSKSAELYDFSLNVLADKNKKKCATGLFHLVRNGPLFTEDHHRRQPYAKNNVE